MRDAKNTSRIRKLEQYSILHTLQEPEFDRLTKLAALICNTPISLITILTDEQQWFKSKIGVDIDSTPIEHAFCNHAIRQTEIFEITDATQDARFIDNPFVTGAPDIRFYAGCPLVDTDGFALGTLCVIDRQPRRLNDQQREALRLLADEVLDLIKLRAYKETYEEFFELVPEMLCMVDSDGTFLRVNPAWETTLHYKPEELIGKISQSLVHPDDLAPAISALSMLKNGQTVKGFVNRYLRRDGTYCYLEWNARSVGGLIFSACKDITLELKAREDIKRSEERYRLLTELVSDYVYEARIADDRIYIEWVSDNVERILSYSVEELAVPGTWDKILYPEDTNKLTRDSRRLTDNAEKVNEYRIITKSGEVRWMRDYNRIIRRDNDKDGFLIGATKDITKEKEAESVLQQKEQMLLERNSQLEQLIELTKRQNDRLKEYTYITSHNLRSSVANIISLTDLFYTMPNDLQLLEMLRTTACQLDSTIRKMNILLDVDSMAEATEKQPVLLLDAINGNVEMLHNRLIDTTQINISVPAQLTVAALPAYIDSILHNLISNALKYRRSDVNHRIDIKAYESEDFVVIEVADNGIGMDLEKNRDKLFRMSSRLHTDREGKGLGLFLTKHQIETMGGLIQVESMPGEGSVFRVFLPKT
ncbi:GAF domain-containing sensor histidine kinase [Rhodoflexus sp.]